MIRFGLKVERGGGQSSSPEELGFHFYARKMFTKLSGAAPSFLTKELTETSITVRESS